MKSPIQALELPGLAGGYLAAQRAAGRAGGGTGRRAGGRWGGGGGDEAAAGAPPADGKAGGLEDLEREPVHRHVVLARGGVAQQRLVHRVVAAHHAPLAGQPARPRRRRVEGGADGGGGRRGGRRARSLRLEPLVLQNAGPLELGVLALAPRRAARGLDELIDRHRRRRCALRQRRLDRDAGVGWRGAAHEQLGLRHACKRPGVRAGSGRGSSSGAEVWRAPG